MGHSLRERGRLAVVLMSGVVLALQLPACQDRIGKLAGQLECGNWCDRSKAARAMGKSGDDRAVKHLARALDDQNWRVRRQAVRSLSGFPSPGVTDHLIVSLADDSWQVRREAIRALTGRPDPRVPETLILSLRDHSRRVRAEAARALTRTNAGQSTDALADALADWHAGRAAANALLEFDWKPETDRHLVHLWVAMELDDSLRAHWRTAKPVLLEDIESDGSLRVENALNALISLGNPEVLQELVDALGQIDSRSLAEAYANSGQPRLREAANRWANERDLTLTRRPAVRPVVWASW